MLPRPASMLICFALLASVSAFLPSAFVISKAPHVSYHCLSSKQSSKFSLKLRSTEGSTEDNSDPNMVPGFKKRPPESDLMAIDFDSRTHVPTVIEILQGLPYAAILPVQPLQALPTETGIDITFLKKGGKGSGIKFDVVYNGPTATLTATRIPDGTKEDAPEKRLSERLILNRVLNTFEEELQASLEKWPHGREPPVIMSGASSRWRLASKLQVSGGSECDAKQADRKEGK